MRFWTSDLHFGHVNIIKYTNRPFDDLDHMREMFIKNWNETVSPYDTVNIVGDFAMGRIEDTLPVAYRLNGEKILVMGNHDRPWKGSPQRQKDKWKSEYEKYFWLQDGPVYDQIGEHLVLVSHFPYRSIERHQDRYDEYAPVDDGAWLIHGHTHLSNKIDRRLRQIHVGVDAWNYRPVSDEEILELIEG